MISNRNAAICWHNVNLPYLKLAARSYDLNRQNATSLENSVQATRSGGIKMLSQYNGGRKTCGQSTHQHRERLDSPSRRPDYDEIVRRSGYILTLALSTPPSAARSQIIAVDRSNTRYWIVCTYINYIPLQKHETMRTLCTFEQTLSQLRGRKHSK